MATDIILAVVAPVIEYLVDPIKRQVSYLCCYSCNVKSLDHEILQLSTVKESLQRDVDAARNNLEDLRPEVESWLSKVEEVKKKSLRIRDDTDEVKGSCLSKWCPMMHYSLSRRAQKTTEASRQLRKERPNKISNPINLADLPPLPPTSEIGFRSRDSIEKDIMDALKDDSVYQIGLCGMGGIGKTTMAKKIERWAREKREDTGPMFKHVLMVVVSQQPNPSKIQKEIAEVLGLDLGQFESAIKRAELLHKRLKDEKSALIILDDVWEPLKLEEELGLPAHVGCKLILTSRYKKALPLTMHDAKLFSLELLDDKESWDLFKENAGNEIDSPDLHPVAEDIVKECAGLPLALVVLGSALRGERKSSWEDALLQLQQQSMPANIEKVCRPLLLSFRHLQSEEQRNLFLLCCLFPEDYVISVEELVHYGLGLQILEGVSNLRQARKRVESILEKLISRSLLIESSDEVGNLHVKMHDVIRDVGIWIASSDNVESKGKHFFFISHGVNGLTPKEDDSYTCISLTSSGENIIHVLECANCTKLQLLRIYGDKIYGVPENLFSGLRGLKVLEASKLSSLPSSIHLLSNLRNLHLVKCKLEMMSAIGQLINLQILSLKNCKGSVLPEEIGGLKKLRKLDVTGCLDLRRIAFGVISRLVRLEELIMFDCFGEWESEGEDHEITNAKLEELDSLNYLTVLCIQIKDPNALPKERPRWTQTVTKYHIKVSSVPEVSSLNPALNPRGFEKAILVGKQAVPSLEDWFCGMARDADYLDLHWGSCSNVMEMLAPSGYPKLKYFKLSDIENLTSLDTVGSPRLVFVPTRQAPSSPAPTEGKQYGGAIFPILKHLDICYSESLQEISSGQPPLGSFQALEEIRLDGLSGLSHLWSEKVHLPNLRTVRIFQCARLSYLLPLSVAQSLAKLEVLEVSFCPMIEEIFKMEEGQMEIAISKTEFPKLDKMMLPTYCSFCKGVDGIEAPALTELQINNSPSITGEGGQKEFLFEPQVACNNLVVRMMRLSLANFNLSSQLQELEIISVHNFKSLFSPPIVNGFPSLKVLVLRDCKMMEEVIRKEENVEEAKANRTLFPQLLSLTLSRLPKILAFCHILGNIEFPSLVALKVKECPAMETLVQGLSNAQGQVFFSKEVLCPKLKSLKLVGTNVVKIWSDIIPIDNFCGLEELTVRSCPRMTNLFSPAVFRSLTSICELILVHCEELEEVIAMEEEAEGPSGINQTLSPRLQTLRLKDLPKMRNICHLRSHLQLPSLEYVRIRECPMLERFSQGPLHLPSLKRLYGLSDTNFAAKIFFNKEIPSNESHLDSNCFTIPASDLISSNPDSLYLLLERDSSDSFVSVLRNYPGVASGEVKIKGNFDITKLQAGIVYEIIFILMLEKYSGGWEEPIDLELTQPGGALGQYRTEILEGKPRDKWFEISVGEFTREPPHQFGHIEFSLAYEEAYGLSTKGVRIRIKFQNVRESNLLVQNNVIIFDIQLVYKVCKGGIPFRHLLVALIHICLLLSDQLAIDGNIHIHISMF